MNPYIPDNIRPDYKAIVEMIRPGSKVLDLGCGDGELLTLLIQHKNCHGTGIEIDEKAIFQCVTKGVTVSHADINSGLSDYSNKRFDYVILNESLQQVLHPADVIREALRVGKQIIVGVPNFCQLSARIQIFFGGRVPVTKELPYQWYETPNLRFFSIKDFQIFCKTNGITIRRQKSLSGGKEVRCFPNLFANIGLFLLEKP